MNSKTAYWISFAATAALFVSSGYNVIKALLEDPDLVSLLEKEEEIAIELQSLHNVLTSDFAIKIMSYINQIFQKDFDESFSHLIAQRRKLLYSPQEYEKVSKDLIGESDELFSICVSRLLKSLNVKFTLEEITNEISKMSPEEKEKLFYKYDKMSISTSLTIDQIKKAFELYHSAFKNEMKMFQEYSSRQANASHTEEEKEDIAYRYIISQIRASDVLYLKYRITDRELVYLIYDSKLIYTDSQIKQMNNELHQMDNMLTTNNYSLFN